MYPTRTPAPKRFSRVDYEDVQQEDGRIAVFRWDADEASKGWQVRFFTDPNGFRFYDSAEQTGADAINLVRSEVGFEKVHGKPPIEAAGEGEELHAFMFGGMLSIRAGWYVTPKDDPGRVLKVKLVMMS